MPIKGILFIFFLAIVTAFVGRDIICDWLKEIFEINDTEDEK